MTESPQALLLLPHLRIQNANMISGPMTWGFPAPTGFAGFVHALSRRVAESLDLKLEGVGIVCHKFDPQISRPPGKRTNVLCLTRNPVKKDGKTASIVEEGRVHLEVSLVIGVSGDGLWQGDDIEDLAHELYEGAQAMRIAGGSVLPQTSSRYKASLEVVPEDLDGIASFTKRYRRALLPGFALVERQDILQERHKELAATAPGTSSLEALLDLCRMNFQPNAGATEEDAEVQWSIVRRMPGWLVPVPLGYAAISPLYEAGEVANTRDSTTPFRFVESALGLGQWLSPHRINNIESLLWHYEAELEDGLYGCRNHYTNIELRERE